LGRTGLVGVSLEFTHDSQRELVEQVVALVLERLPQPDPPSPYMTTAEAAAYLRAKPQRVHDLLSSGRLTRFKDGSRTLVLRTELEALVEQRPR
jgi:excisionase family DNA binding protein